MPFQVLGYVNIYVLAQHTMFSRFRNYFMADYIYTFYVDERYYNDSYIRIWTRPDTGKIMAVKTRHEKNAIEKNVIKKRMTKVTLTVIAMMKIVTINTASPKKSDIIKKHGDPECMKKGCSVMPNKDDGNCDEIKRENGYCYKQCYMKCLILIVLVINAAMTVL